MDLFTIRDVRAALKSTKLKRVVVSVHVCEGDFVYIPITKVELMRALKGWPSDSEPVYANMIEDGTELHFG